MPDNTPEPTAAEAHGLPSGSSEFAQISAMMAADEAKNTAAPAIPATQQTETETPATQSADDQPAIDPSLLDDSPATPAKPAPASIRKVGRVVKTQRTYDGLDPDEAELFEQMGNPAYDKLYPLFKKLKEAGGLDKLVGRQTELEKERAELEKARFYDHPDAYRLSPEYAQQQKIVENIDEVDNFWQEQLSLLHAGKPAKIIVRDAQGRMSVSAETYEPSPALQTRILSELAGVKADRNEAVARLGQIRETFKNQYVQYETEFGRIQKHLFGAVEDKIKDQVQKELALIPSYARHKPEVQFAARALALLRLTIAKNKQAAAAASVKTVTDQIEASNGPTAASIATGPTKTKAAATASDKDIEESIRRAYR